MQDDYKKAYSKPSIAAGTIPPGYHNSKYTDRLIERVLAFIRAGAFESVACRRCRISRETLRVWKKEYPGLSDRIKEAAALPEVQAIAGILKAGKRDWRALVWYLEKKHPFKWGKYAGGEQGDDDNEDEKNQSVVRTLVESGATLVIPAGSTQEQAHAAYMASKGSKESE